MSRAYRSFEAKRNHPSWKATKLVKQPSLTTVKPIPRNRLNPGVIVWGHIPFNDGTGEKSRPSVVVEASAHEVVLMPCTTSAKRLEHPTKYVEVEDLNTAGMVKPSAVALRLVTIPRIDLISITGELSDADTERLIDALGRSDLTNNGVHPFAA